MMELLFELHNEKYGYAFPSFKTLLDAFNTTSKNRVSKVLKDLEEKGFITVDRDKRSNRYIINDLTSYLKAEDKPAVRKDVEDEVIDDTMKQKIEIVEKTIKRKASKKMKAKLENIELEELKILDEEKNQQCEKINETYYIRAIDIFLSNKNNAKKTGKTLRFKPSMATRSGVGMVVEGKDFLDYEEDEFNKLVEMKQRERYGNQMPKAL